MPNGSGGKAVVFYLSAGGGHRSAARAVAAAAARRHPSMTVAIHDLADVLLPLDPLRRSLGINLDDAYNAMVRRGLTAGLVPLLRAFQSLVKVRHKALSACVAHFLEVEKPDVVMSVLPNFNAVLRDAVRAALPGVPFAVTLTDLADFPSNFWIVPGLDRVLVATDEAVAQAEKTGIPRGAIRRTSGMILNPDGHSSAGPSRRESRDVLGLSHEAFVVLCLFGGKGAPEMAPLARKLLRLDSSWTVIAIAGQNPSLEKRLRAVEAAASGRLRVYGFTNEVGRLMAASDLLLTKPGPGSLAEAFHHRLPAIVPLNAFTIPQERFNARMLEARQLGVKVRDWRHMADAARDLRREGNALAAIRARLGLLPENRAVDEVVDELASLARHA